METDEEIMTMETSGGEKKEKRKGAFFKSECKGFQEGGNDNKEREDSKKERGEKTILEWEMWNTKRKNFNKKNTSYVVFRYNSPL